MRIAALPLTVTIFGAWANAQPQDTPPTLNRATRRVAVAWDLSTNGSGAVRALSVVSPWGFETPPLQTGPQSVLRSAGGLVYVVSAAQDTVTAVDPDTWTALRVYPLANSSEPLDIAVVSHRLAYVTRRNATHLLRLDLITGASAEVVDLGVFADSDGVPDLGMMAVHQGRLFVQIRRFNDSGPGWFAPPAYLAVVDIPSEQLYIRV